MRLALQNPWAVKLLVIAARRAPEACPEAEVVVPHAKLLERSMACGSLLARRGLRTGMPAHVFLKWHLFALTPFDAVFFSDLDVDVMPLELHPLPVRAKAMSKRCEAARGSQMAPHTPPVNLGEAHVRVCAAGVCRCALAEDAAGTCAAQL